MTITKNKAMAKLRSCSYSKKKKNGIVIVIEKLQKSLSIGRSSRSSSIDLHNDFDQEVYDSAYVPEDVKEGHFAVLAMNDDYEPKRYVVPLLYLSHPVFVQLLEQAAEEYGFCHEGALSIPCRGSEIERILGDQWKEDRHTTNNDNVGVEWNTPSKTMLQSC